MGCLALVGVLAILLAVVVSSSWPGMRWPDVRNSQVLRSDCAALVAKQEAEYIPKEEWPESIKDLTPKAVKTEGDHVNIAISGGGIGAGWGYVIFPGTATVRSERLTNLKIWGTGQEGIFRYQTVH